MLGTGRDTRTKSKPYNRLLIKKVVFAHCHHLPLCFPTRQSPIFGVRVHRQLYRLQNPTQWDLYTTHRDRIVSQRQTAFDSDEKEPVNNIVPRTLQIMRQNKDCFGQFVMESGANEAYLFHGTRVSL